MSDLKALLGKRRDDFIVRRFLKELGDDAKVLAEEDGTYYEFQQRGVSLLFDLEERLKAIYLYHAGRDGYTQYAGDLPDRITFMDHQDDVLRKLGAPSKAGGGEASLLYEVVPNWIRYDHDGYSVHVELSAADGSVSLVTLMSPEAVPAR
jgi:filamentous hemagglutinin